eukprot:gene7876-28303_t
MPLTLQPGGTPVRTFGDISNQKLLAKGNVTPPVKKALSSPSTPVMATPRTQMRDQLRPKTHLAKGIALKKQGVKSVYQNHYQMTPSRKLMQGGIHRNKTRLNNGGATQDLYRQSHIDETLKSRGYVKPAAKFFETPEQAAAKRKQTALKKKLAERRAGAMAANPEAGLKAVDQTNNVGSEIKQKDAELERLRATQLARLQLAEQQIKELEAAKQAQAKELATQTAELKQLSQAKAAADTAKAQAGVLASKTAELEARAAEKDAELALMKLAQEQTAADRAAQLTSLKEVDVQRQAQLAAKEAELQQLEFAKLEFIAAREAEFEKLTAEKAAEFEKLSAAKDEAAASVLAAAKAVAKIVVAAPVVVEEEAVVAAAAPVIEEAPAITHEAKQQVVSSSEFAATRIALRAIMQAKIVTEDDVRALTYELAKVLAPGAMISEAGANAACGIMEQIGSKQGILQQQEAEIESLQGLTISRETTPITRHSSELAKQLMVSKRHVVKRQSSVGMNIDRRVLAGVEMAINETIAEKDARLQQQDEQLSKATHMLQHAARVKQLQDAKMAQMSSAVNGSGSEIQTLRMMQNYQTRAHDAIREELAYSRNSVLVLDQQNLMLKEQLEMAQAMAAPVQMRKKKSKTKSSSSLRNRLSKTFSFGGKKSKKNEAKRMSKMATIPAGRPVSVAHAHAPAPTSVPTPAAAPMTMPVAGTHTAASATTDMFAVQAPVATEEGIVPVAATAASPKATVQRHSLIFSPSSSMV